mmetsp:Transcript_11353/g.17021  ORF Transcript_11353/g.17021 Transcript_11353/m.17021 type:complete len:98 (-) Transcript_11353:30-323(-)
MSTKEVVLPKAVINRILKKVLPDGTNISKEAKLGFEESTKIFIHYLTEAARDLCQQDGRSMLSDKDIYAALKELDMDTMIEPLEASLTHYQKVKQKR